MEDLEMHFKKSETNYPAPNLQSTPTENAPTLTTEPAKPHHEEST